MSNATNQDNGGEAGVTQVVAPISTPAIKTDNLVSNLNGLYKNAVDDVLLNLGVDEGVEKPAALTGNLRYVQTLHASLILEMLVSTAQLEGVLSVPRSKIRAAGVVRTFARVGGVLRLPAETIRLSGRVLDGEPVKVTGSIVIPRTNPHAVLSLVWRTSIFRGLVGSTGSKWQGAGFAVSEVSTRHQVAVPKRLETGFKWQAGTSFVLDRGASYSAAQSVIRMSGDSYKGAIALYGAELSAMHDTATRFRTYASSVYRPAVNLPVSSFGSRYNKLTPVEQAVDSSYNAAKTLIMYTVSPYTSAVKRYRSWLNPWSKATPLNREGFERIVNPWVPPVKKPYNGDGRLNLICRYKGKSDNIYLNLAVNRCYTKKSIGSRSTYIVLNEITVQRYGDGKSIHPTSVSMSTDRDSWCWSFSMNLPQSQLENLRPREGELPLIRIILNNKLFVFLVEAKKRSRAFGSTSFVVTGRSITALLDSPHAGRRTYTQGGVMDSTQLVQQELERVADTTILLDWVDFVSRNGWVLPAGSLSYSNLTPIEAIKEIVTPLGGVVLSDPAIPMIKVKARTPHGHWETPLIKMSIPEDIIQQDSSEWIGAQAANAVYVYSASVSLGARVTRLGSAGDVMAEQLVSRMYTDATSLREAGRNKLIESNPREITQYSTAMYEELGIPELCEALEITSETGSFWGTVDSVSVSVDVSGEVTTIDVSVGVERFLEATEVSL